MLRQRIDSTAKLELELDHKYICRYMASVLLTTADTSKSKAAIASVKLQCSITELALSSHVLVYL